MPDHQTPATDATPGGPAAGTRGLPEPGGEQVPPCSAGSPRPRTVRVVGVDLSLRSTGIAGSTGWADRLVPPAGARDLLRLRWLVDEVRLNVTAATLVVLEGPAHSRAAQAGHHELAGLWWMVRDRLARMDIPVAVVSPSARAKYATGRGNAGKDEVLAAVIRRYPDVEITGNDQADAYTLAAMGADWLGHPPAYVPAIQRAVLDKVDWPEVTP